MFPHYEHFRQLDRYRRRQIRKIVVDRSNPLEYLSQDEFFNKFRLTKECTHDLVRRVKSHLPQTADKRGSPVPPHLQVLITLRYIAAGCEQVELSSFFHVSQTCVSRCISRVSFAIGMLSAEIISFPLNNDVNKTMQEFHQMGEMPGVIGCIGTTHIAIEKPSCPQPEEFKNPEGYYSLHVQGVCGPQQQFYSFLAECPGSNNNSTIFHSSQLYQEFEDGLYRGHLLGSGGYPCRRYLLTPLPAPLNHSQIRYNAAHNKTLSSVDGAFSLLKRRFACLRKHMRTSMRNTKSIIIAAAVLHNLAIMHKVPEFDEEEEESPDEPKKYDENLGGGDWQSDMIYGSVQDHTTREQIIRDYFE